MKDTICCYKHLFCEYCYIIQINICYETVWVIPYHTGKFCLKVKAFNPALMTNSNGW